MRLDVTGESDAVPANDADPHRRLRRYFYKQRWLKRLVATVDRCGESFVRRRSTSTESPRRLVVLKADNLGDVLLAMPTLARLRRAARGAEITLACAAPAVGLLTAADFADRVVGLVPPGRRSARWPAAVTRFAAAVRLLWRVRPDAAIDLEANPLNLVAMRLAGVRVRVGFDNAGLGFLLTHRFDMLARNHRSDALLQVLSAFESGTRPESGTARLRIACDVPDGMRAFVAQTGELPARLVALHPYAGCQSKQWPIEYWQVLCETLQDADFVPVLVGTAAEAEEYGRIVPRSQRPAVDLVGATSTRQLASALSMCDVVIGNDSGPVHLAAGLGVPTVVVFSAANSPRTWAPRGDHIRVLHSPPPCAMCELTYCSHRSCLRAIDPEDVLREVHDVAGQCVRPASPTLAIGT